MHYDDISHKLSPPSRNHRSISLMPPVLRRRSSSNTAACTLSNIGPATGDERRGVIQSLPVPLSHTRVGVTGMHPQHFHPPHTDPPDPTVREVHAHETALTYRAVAALRPGSAPLATLATFVSWVNTRHRPEGYRLLACFVAGSDDAVAVAGFRRWHSLLTGDCLYLDDLVTLPEGRGRGHADALFSWLIAEAQRLGCAQRHTAHRFYLNHRHAITALHFQMAVAPMEER